VEVPTGSISFLMTDHLEDDTPTTAVKRGGSIQPQALGPQKRSNVGSSAAFSSQDKLRSLIPKQRPPSAIGLNPLDQVVRQTGPSPRGRRRRDPPGGGAAQEKLRVELRRNQMQDRPMLRPLTQCQRPKQLHSYHRRTFDDNQAMLLSGPSRTLAGISERLSRSIENNKKQLQISPERRAT
jgi:hypothetical protein